MTNAHESFPAPNAVNQSQLIVAMRGDMLSAISAIIGVGQMLCDSAADGECSDQTFAELSEFAQASKDLYQFVNAELNADWKDLDTAQFEERFRRTRHDILNHLNRPLGLCQMLQMQHDDGYLTSLANDLSWIEAQCKACVAKVQRYANVDVNTGSDSAADSVTPQDRAEYISESGSLRRRDNVASASVLVVDDSAENRQLLAEFLEREGHRVRVAADGQEALQTMQRDEFDLVLLDLIMPGMNGFQVLKKLEANERLRHTPVIVLSGFFDPDHVVTCIEMGAEDHLPKPVDFNLLRARMNSAVEKRRLREREFSQFFTPELARHFVHNPELLTVGRDANVTVLFCDIRGFSRISEELGPAETVSWLSDVMATLSDAVMKYQGVLVDYVGDELMAMWGAPDEIDDHAVLACRAAIEILDSLPAINDRWRDRIRDTTDVGIGLNSGIARVGNTGSNRKFKYGPLGNTVNVASRVQGATKYLRSNLLVAGSTHDMLNGKLAARRLCKVRVVNIDTPIDLYEIRPRKQNDENNLSARYESALNAFESQQLIKAAKLLGGLLVDQPEDGPSLLLMSRVVGMLLAPPEQFDSVWDLPGK